MDKIDMEKVKKYGTYFVTTVSPALTTLIAALGPVYHFSFTNDLIVVIGAGTTFLGTLLGIRSATATAPLEISTDVTKPDKKEDAK